MGDCCAAGPANLSEGASCPLSADRGRPVDLITVKALLTEEALARLAPAVYRFCVDHDCPVVYFAEGAGVFTTSDVRAPVFHKQPFGDRIVCYCFGVTEAGIRHDVEQWGASPAVQRVREHIKAGRCACEVRNPRGTCCLGDLEAAVARATQGRTAAVER